MPQTPAASTLSQLNQTYDGAIQHNRALLEDASVFLRNESVRFLNLRLERSRQTMDRLNDCQDVPGLLTVQQEWMRDLMQDWFAQGQRYSEMLQQGAGRMQAAMQAQAEETVEAAEEMAEAVQESAQDAPVPENQPADNNEPHYH